MRSIISTFIVLQSGVEVRNRDERTRHVRGEVSEVQKQREYLDDLVAYFVVELSMMRKCDYVNGSVTKNSVIQQ